MTTATLLKRFKTTVCAVLLAAAVLSCKEMKAAKQIQEGIQTEFSVAASVRVNTSPNAKTVVISLPPMPSAEPEKVKARITEIAKERVPDADQVIINLTL